MTCHSLGSFKCIRAGCKRKPRCQNCWESEKGFSRSKRSVFPRNTKLSFPPTGEQLCDSDLKNVIIAGLGFLFMYIISQPAADASKFGGLFEPWNSTELAYAREHMSYIHIDSKNYAKWKIGHSILKSCSTRWP